MENYAFLSGGAIVADSFQKIELKSGSFFYRNRAILKGGDSLAIKNSLSGSLYISDTIFTSNIASNFILCEELSYLFLDRSTLRHEKYYSRKQNKTAGLTLVNIMDFLISDCSF